MHHVDIQDQYEEFDLIEDLIESMSRVIRNEKRTMTEEFYLIRFEEIAEVFYTVFIDMIPSEMKFC